MISRDHTANSHNLRKVSEPTVYRLQEKLCWSKLIHPVIEQCQIS